MGTVKWERLSGLRTPVIMILAIVAGAIGVFQIYVPAGWLFLMLALLFIAYVTDSDTTPGGPRR